MSCHVNQGLTVLPEVHCHRIAATVCPDLVAHVCVFVYLHTFVSVCVVCSYNHYAGRLGIPMPETSKLLAAHPVEFFSFHCE